MARNKSEKELRIEVRRKKQRLRKIDIYAGGRKVGSFDITTASNY